MPNPKIVVIADLSGAGPHDDLDAWAKQVVARLSGTGSFERVARYRRLNEVRTLVVADGDDPRGAEAVRAALADPPAPFSGEVVVATQQGERQRPDVRDDPRDVPLLYTVTFPVPPDREAELAAWYDEEHMEMLQGSPYWPMTRRFRVEQPAPAHWGAHLAIHYLSDIQALRSPERDEARRTPWRDRLMAEPWFRRGSYNVCLQEL